MGNMKRTLGILFAVLVVVVVISQLTTRSRLATEEGGGYVELVPPSFETASVGKIRAWSGRPPGGPESTMMSGSLTPTMPTRRLTLRSPWRTGGTPGAGRLSG